MQRTTIDFGIDLGTTNSSISVIDETDAKIIPNKGGSTTTPSAVWIDKRGRLHVGHEAKLQALVGDQDNATCEFKLQMGMGARAKKVFVRSERVMTPKELSAEVLKQLKTDVQSSMGEAVRAAVITVPAAFDNPQTTATQKAAELAGLTRAPLLLEPVAASLAYGFQTKSENVYWFVYDFGGGTFDAALMRIRDGLIQVVDHDGDNMLGGKAIDWDIVDKRLCPAVRKAHNLPDFRRGVERWTEAMNKLKWAAEEAKIEVCRTKEPFEIWCEGLCQDDKGNDIDFEFRLSPEDVKELSQPWIEKSLGLCRKTLERSGLEGKKLDRVLMVGGTTLNPWVRDAVKQELGCELEFGIDPVTVVARGAAIFASTQERPGAGDEVSSGTWKIDIQHKPIGNVADPDIGGRVESPDGQSVAGCTIEFVDTKSYWRSGRIELGEEGVFMTQLFADEKRRCEYAVELRDATGNQLEVFPERVAYQIGVETSDPPAAKSIGVGLANGEMKPYIKKGSEIPKHGLRKAMDHYTTVALRAGHAEDELRIPLLEGEHPRATRNHRIGELKVTGADIKRDLPVHSQVEITVIIDQSQLLRLQVYVNSLDEDFEVPFEPAQQVPSIAEAREEFQKQLERLAAAREKASKTGAIKAESVLQRVEKEELVEHIESLAEAAETDEATLVELDRGVRELAAAIDEVEDSVELPELIDQAQEALRDTQGVIDEHGEGRDRQNLRALRSDVEKAIHSGDADLLRRYERELLGLRFDVLERQPGFHVGRFEWLEERMSTMGDPKQAERLVSQGRRAMNNNDLEGLKAANRQLISLLPEDKQAEAEDPRIGTTLTHD